MALIDCGRSPFNDKNCLCTCMCVIGREIEREKTDEKCTSLDVEGTKIYISSILTFLRRSPLLSRELSSHMYNIERGKGKIDLVLR